MPVVCGGWGNGMGYLVADKTYDKSIPMHPQQPRQTPRARLVRTPSGGGGGSGAGSGIASSPVPTSGSLFAGLKTSPGAAGSGGGGSGGAGQSLDALMMMGGPPPSGGFMAPIQPVPVQQQQQPSVIAAQPIYPRPLGSQPPASGYDPMSAFDDLR